MRTTAFLFLLSTGLAAQDDGVDFFESRIRPLLAEQCLKCHGEKKAKGGLRLDSRAGWQKGGDSGPAILPKKAASSLLIKLVRGEPESPPQMPPEHPLPASAIADLVRWVDLGAPDPRSGAAAVAKTIDWKAATEFWAFRPPVSSSGRPIDAYIAETLAAKNLKPAGAADRATLLRRASFDLTGLPPTDAELRDFIADSIADPSPAAFARVVDRLLASPAYGEHQARLWLDLARYAEDQAHVSEGKLGFAWRYRDWVVEAFNQDLPYDRFVKLQIAADQMGSPPEDRRALGFLGLGNVYARPNDLARAKAEQWDDRVDTLTRSFLGLTVSCARCHDHKFDPIPTLDYYSLTGVIAGTKDSVLWAAPAEQVSVYEAAAAKSSEAAGKASAFLQAETDRRALQKVDVLISAARALGRPAGTDAFRSAIQKYLSKPLKDRDKKWQKGVLALPEKVVVGAASAAWKAEHEGLTAAAKSMAAAVPPEPARCHGVADEKPVDLKVFIRGNPAKHGEPAPRRFLRVLAGADAPRFTQGSGRRELADAIADPRNPLTARVLVNRLWQQHFGRGLVSTPSNFGVLGARPTHPELLDALAERFIQGGWSIKAMHRMMMLTDAYRRSSTIDPAAQAVDPENQWLWRMSRRRLSVEEMRDAVLAVSGGLDRSMGGPSGDVDDPAYLRRTIYGKVSRGELSRLLRTFDFPDPNLSSERRIDTTLPQQSLFLLNSPFMIARGKALAARGGDAAGIVRAALGREPAPDETAIAAGFLKVPGREAAFAQALLASNEFLFVD